MFRKQYSNKEMYIAMQLQQLKDPRGLKGMSLPKEILFSFLAGEVYEFTKKNNYFHALHKKFWKLFLCRVKEISHTSNLFGEGDKY